MKKYLNPIIWIFISIAAAFLYFSMRSKENQVVYTVIALALWGVAALLNRYKKKEE